MKRALFVVEEMRSLEMGLICLLVAVDLHDTDGVWLLFDLHGEDTDHTGLSFNGLCAHIMRCSQIGLQIAVVDLNLRDANDFC